MTANPAPVFAAPAPPVVVTAAPARFGENRRANLPVLIVTLLLHIAVVAAFLMVREHFVAKRHETLTVVNLTPAPPPPASTPDTPKPQQVVVVSPAPAIEIPRPSPVQIVTTPDPVPQPIAPAPPAATPAPPAPPAPPSIVQASDLGSKMVAGKAPTYPIESRRKKEQGTVVLTLTLAFDGHVADISVSRSSGFGRLDQAALAAVRKWRWEPTLRSGQPVMVKGMVEIPFILQG